MEKIVGTRVWNMAIPNGTKGLWFFSFHVEFEQVSAQRVVVNWTELLLGRGQIKLNHRGLCWGCLFETYKKLERLAEDHAYEWNVIDAKNG